MAQDSDTCIHCPGDCVYRLCRVCPCPVCKERNEHDADMRLLRSAHNYR